MSEVEVSGSGWLISGFQAVIVTWGWLGVVLLYGLFRSLRGAEQDPIRPSGPSD